MRILTLTQPWASLLASGAKLIETRSWSTSYRGAIAIHAAKGFPKTARDLCMRPTFAMRLLDAGYQHVNELPRGKVICVTWLDDVVPVERIVSSISVQERIFGDYTPGRFAWVMISRRVRVLDQPIPFVGTLGLRRASAELIAQVQAQGIHVDAAA